MNHVDADGVHSALYSDANCYAKVDGSDDVWDNAPMNTCSGKDGYSVYPVCESGLQYNVLSMAHVDGYMSDDTCSDEDQLVQNQYFVTDECFVVNGTSSRKQICTESGN
mgnify:CR=1 FL=1